MPPKPADIVAAQPCAMIVHPMFIRVNNSFGECLSMFVPKGSLTGWVKQEGSGPPEIPGDREFLIALLLPGLTELARFKNQPARVYDMDTENE